MCLGLACLLACLLVCLSPAIVPPPITTGRYRSNRTFVSFPSWACVSSPICIALTHGRRLTRLDARSTSARKMQSR
ncbi:hypothetical protein LX32DRAFT_646612 [Colletotrichum zoysiae]|uniref:Secreted protein n=1 Tax=Colletotrichum zoysiae TaxID=1216348 RepID=A0AAD9LUS2_9PEZI|nr:hypothetical protein LX32DRAFT_646612 [Colletotrichum zoysiae]